MTVKEVFDLRKQGRIEEAYEAIKPMYAAHRGRYTTLCMFWTAADVFKLRLEQKQCDEASKILEALKRMLPRVEEITKQLDSERPASGTTDKSAKNKHQLPWEKTDPKTSDEQNKAAAFIASATRRLEKAQKGKNDKKAPSGATIAQPAHKPHSPHPSTLTAPSANPSHPENPCPTEEKATNSQLLHDYPGHLIVSLDDGIIRPTADLNPGQRIVLACITAHPGYNVPQISTSTGIPAKSVERHISALISHGLITHQGSKKNGGYYVK